MEVPLDVVWRREKLLAGIFFMLGVVSLVTGVQGFQVERMGGYKFLMSPVSGVVAAGLFLLLCSGWLDLARWSTGLIMVSHQWSSEQARLGWGCARNGD